MKATYDAEVDVLRLVFSSEPVDESDEEKPGIIIDYDANGQIVSIEILDASKRAEKPFTFEYAVVGKAA
ncbi:DUF2283 domain-containing protein [Candidatus Oscillochloris fontis]|uniref:DUF2283 domain-containing protein n=1 Tax=Candidatus Oscillochloris fontis TaxID=2496868 RepID=UPI00101E1E21|nr:DUF2283 domain-containing protein [Candidatus Oscillochloris fontis]